MDMTVTRDLAKVYNTNERNREAVELYEKARIHYMSLPQQIKPDGDLVRLLTGAAQETFV